METALITGGTSGIGFAIAKKLAQSGYGTILLAASNAEALADAKKRLEKESGVTVGVYRQDLGEIGAAQKLYDCVKGGGAEVSLLVNNAGFGLAGAAEKIDMAQDEKMLILNMISLAELCKLFLPGMYRRGYGSIWNVASTGAFQPGPYTASYFASKAFVKSYSEGLYHEAKRYGVHVGALCPGATKTRFFEREGKRTPRGAMTAEAVAESAFRAFARGRRICVPGLRNKLLLAVPSAIKTAVVAGMKR